MIITVTQDDIDNGQIGECSRCPVARAMIRALNIPEDVENLEDVLLVGVLGYALYQNGDYQQMIKLPESATRFINAFDEGCFVEPFEFAVAV